jgi:hypothetical protein
MPVWLSRFSKRLPKELSWRMNLMLLAVCGVFLYVMTLCVWQLTLAHLRKLTLAHLGKFDGPLSC